MGTRRGFDRGMREQEWPVCCRGHFDTVRITKTRAFNRVVLLGDEARTHGASAHQAGISSRFARDAQPFTFLAFDRIREHVGPGPTRSAPIPCRTMFAGASSAILRQIGAGSPPAIA